MVGSDDRGQAYTLEGLVGAALILLALLYAIQSLIITPTTGGPADSDVEAALQQEAEDVLSITARNRTFGLNNLVRYWNQSDGTFTGAINPRIGYGNRAPPGGFGTMLEETFTQRAQSYNVFVRYRGRNISDGTKQLTLVDRGRPTGSSVVASQTVVLYDNMTLTSPSASNAELWQYDTNATANPVDGKSGYYPIPNAVEGPVYNIVEVRLVVW
jgi:hypothetical protein